MSNVVVRYSWQRFPLGASVPVDRRALTLCKTSADDLLDAGISAFFLLFQDAAAGQCDGFFNQLI